MIKINKIIGSIWMLTLFISLFSGTIYASDYAKIAGCHNCTEADRTMAATRLFGRTENGYAYIVDYPSREYVKYLVYIDWLNTGDRRVPVRRTSTLTMVSTEISALEDLFSLIDELKNETSSFSSAHSAKNEAIANTQSNTSSGFSLNINHIAYNSNGENTYDFIRTSKMRNDMYSVHLATGLNKFGTGFNAVTNTLNLGAINLKELKLHYDFVFPDGSTVKVYPNFLTETYDILPDTARDADNNTIPLTSNEALGENYIFTSSERLTLFTKYIDTWGFRMAELNQSCQRTGTICSLTDNTIVCNTHCL